MNKSTLLSLLFVFLFAGVVQAQAFLQLGAMQVEDQGHRMVATSDGGYITAGSAGTKAVLYKTNCLGALVAQIEKTYIPGPAAFWDVTELADGSIVAVGGAGYASPTDTGGHVVLLKTTADLVETTSSSFQILNKEARGLSVTQSTTGHLLVWGEVTGFSVDFTDAFFQRVSPITLQPTDNPVIFNNGVDLAKSIVPTADSNYLLIGSTYTGNAFDPEALINNNLRAYKVDENGALLWQVAVNQVFKAKYGVARASGAAQNSDTGNFMLGGTLFGGTDEREQDAVFALIGNDGTVLDTTHCAAPGQQQFYGIVAHHDFVGLFTIAGESEGSPLGVPSVAVAQAYELSNTIAFSGATLDPATPISVRDLLELDPGRIAYMGTLPDNPTVLGLTDILIITPAATVSIVYQNCALAATFSVPAVAFQWYREGQAIPGANQGAFFPTAPGLYQLQILDDKGCFGVSDTFRVEGPLAGFTVVPDVLTATFTNTSQGAVTYAWDFGDGSTSTQPNPMHTYAVTGVYSVRLIATDNCGLKDTIVQQIGVTPVNEVSWLSHFSLSPNPTSGVFNLEMSGAPQGKVEFAIFNAVGQLLSQEAVSFQNGWIQQSFDLGHLPGGVYSLQIRSGKEMKNVRVVKQ
ncbi:MAG: PKD domain-containing protein [Saprospiraceae bacterium]|nr:PKD domain-containing protein [Lewinellaceae bacterium]MBP6810023.1 PKD domain-containing protein [Saprospiraceae bacterium]